MCHIPLFKTSLYESDGDRRYLSPNLNEPVRVLLSLALHPKIQFIGKQTIFISGFWTKVMQRKSIYFLLAQQWRTGSED